MCKKESNYNSAHSIFFLPLLSRQFNLLLKTSIIYVNDTWRDFSPEDIEVVGGDQELPDALSSLTICFVGRWKDYWLKIFTTFVKFHRLEA